MLAHRYTRSPALAVFGMLAATLCATRPARVEADPGSIIRNPGGIQAPVNLFVPPFRNAVFTWSPEEPQTQRPPLTQPQTLFILSIDRVQQTFVGRLYDYLTPSGPVETAVPTTGRIRPLSNGYEVTFVAARRLQQTAFTGWLGEGYHNSQKTWILKGQYTVTRSPLICDRTPGCLQEGPFPFRMIGAANP